jgi:hypothetical protein
MDNYERRLAYAQQRFSWDAAEAAVIVNDRISIGDEDMLLTPAQRRRVRHKRGSLHRPVIRTKTGRVLTDGDIQALSDEAERGYAVVVDGTRISDLVPVLGLRQDEHGIVKT